MTNYPTTTSNPASRFFSGMLTIVAFFISMVWMDVVAGEVVSLLTAAGKICNISEALLGATVLAWGNSIGDFIADTALARAGNPRMGAASCFGSPLFNMLIGFGIARGLHRKYIGSTLQARRKHIGSTYEARRK